MKTIKTLIKLHKFKLDKKQQELKVIRDDIVQLHNFIDSLEERLVSEIKKIKEDPEFSFAFPNFVKQINTQKNKAFEDIKELEKKELKKQKELQKAFQEVKKFEIIKEIKEKEIKEKEEKREQENLDEIAIQKHNS